MVELIVKILINAVALFVAVKVLPSNLLSFNWGNDWWKLLAVALVFALVNSYIKPIVKALSFPISIMTLGLVAFVINAAMLLLVALEHRRVEIGWTWVAPAWQRTGANREAKLLMLGHAFDTLGCRRVEFKTDSLNEPSRTALLGIGAQFEGIFRNHMVMPGGRMRHSAYYSVIDEEWPVVRAGLERSLAR